MGGGGEGYSCYPSFSFCIKALINVMRKRMFFGILDLNSLLFQLRLFDNDVRLLKITVLRDEVVKMQSALNDAAKILFL